MPLSSRTTARPSTRSGSSADGAEQAYHGVEFAPGYDYPMQRIPPSYSDKVLADAVDGMETTVGGAPVAVTIRSYPAGAQLDAAGWLPAGRRGGPTTLWPGPRP